MRAEVCKQVNRLTIAQWGRGGLVKRSLAKKRERLTADVNDRRKISPLVRPLVVRNIRIIRTILRFIVDCVQ